MDYYDGVCLNVLPVCECGEVIRNLSWQQVIDRCEDAMGIVVAKRRRIEFDPVCCPFCGQTIRGLQVSDDFLRCLRGE